MGGMVLGTGGARRRLTHICANGMSRASILAARTVEIMRIPTPYDYRAIPPMSALCASSIERRAGGRLGWRGFAIIGPVIC